MYTEYLLKHIPDLHESLRGFQSHIDNLGGTSPHKILKDFQSESSMRFSKKWPHNGGFSGRSKTGEPKPSEDGKNQQQTQPR